MLEYATRPAIVQDLEKELRGELICPDDRRYEAARKVWNGRINKYPALIVQCTDCVDVVHALKFARHQHLPVAVRSGGHSLSGSSVCQDGIVIDLSRMKGTCINSEYQTGEGPSHSPMMNSLNCQANEQKGGFSTPFRLSTHVRVQINTETID